MRGNGDGRLAVDRPRGIRWLPVDEQAQSSRGGRGSQMKVRNRLAMALLAAGFVLTACNSGGGTNGASPTTVATTSSGSAPTSTARPTSTAPPPAGASATTTAGACPVAPMTTGAALVTSASGDFDGNGIADTLRAYRVVDTWRLRVELAGGGGADVAVAVADGVTGPRGVQALGGFNIDRNRGDEAFATTGGGASTDLVGVWTFANCQLTRLTVNGQPSEFPVGASLRNYSGLTCVAGSGLQVLSASSDDALRTFTLQRTDYAASGTALVAGSSSSSTLPAGDPGLSSASRFTCGTLALR